MPSHLPNRKRAGVAFEEVAMRSIVSGIIVLGVAFSLSPPYRAAEQPEFAAVTAARVHASVSAPAQPREPEPLKTRYLTQ
jgi:hypothetical protein